MEEVLRINDFIYDERENNWCRGRWIIRLFEKEAEAYTSFDREGLYTKFCRSEDVLKKVIQEINKMP